MSVLLRGARRDRREPSPGLVLAIVCTGIFLVSVDLMVVNVALPYVARDFGTRSLGSLSWVINAYVIVYAALLVLGGRLSDNEGHKRAFLLGIALFVTASAACGTASSVPELIAFRAVQGAGAALLSSSSLGLILATAPPDRRQAGVRTWTAVVGIGAATGPVIGGLLVSASWRAVFFINVPIGLLALGLGARLLPGAPRHAGPRPDAFGAALVTGGAATLTLAVVQGAEWGWGASATVLVLAASAVLLAGFVWHCLRHDDPLVAPGLFRSRAFSSVAVVATIFMMAFGGMLLSIVLWEQGAWGFSALQTGLSIAPGALMVPVFSALVVGPATARFGPGPTSAVGGAAFAVGMAWWALAIGPHSDYLGEVLGGMLLAGAGFGVALPTHLATGTASLRPESYATGSGVLNMLRQIGTAVGVAVLVAVLGGATASHARLSSFQTAWMIIAALALLSALGSALALARAAAKGSVAADAIAPVRDVAVTTE
jgi:EmrB/QacA subfamily drug resistance transporter